MRIKNIGIALFVPIIISMILIGMNSCTKEESLEPQGSQGYVQFKLYKKGTAPSTKTMESFTDANKIRVEIKSKETNAVVSKVLDLNYYNEEKAEYGMRSEKMELLPGKYEIQRFKLFNKLEQPVETKNVKVDNEFIVVPGGLAVQNLEIDAPGRGMVTFRLKNFVKNDGPVTKSSGTKPYPLYNVRTMDVILENLRSSSELIELKTIKVKYHEDFVEAPEGWKTDYPDNLIECAYVDCDTLLWLNTGTYRVKSFTAYSDKSGKSILGKTEDCPTTFTVADNKLTENVELRVERSQKDENINDYIALRRIWEKLGGENWSYYGDSYPKGINWNFDKEIDMWGNQPGVSLDREGRVASISIGSFGARGVIPEEIGELTALRSLSIGNHSELTGHPDFDFSDTPDKEMTYESCAFGKSFMNAFVNVDARTGLSPELKDAINDNLKAGQTPIIEKKTVTLPEGYVPEYTSHVTGISKAILRCKHLTNLSIAHAPIRSLELVDLSSESKYKDEEFTWSWDQFENLTDIEFFNLPLLEKHPMDMLVNLPKLISFVSAFNYGISGEQFLNDWTEFLEYGLSADKIQALYLTHNNLEEFPEESLLRKMERISLLDCSFNKIKKLHPFGREISLTKLLLNNNEITEIPKSALDGHFVGYADVEGINFANNKITVLPDIFNAKAVHVMGSVDFSGNQISSVENGDAFKGVNANILNLRDNRFKKFPSEIFKAGSPIGYIILAANGMEEIVPGSLVSDKIYPLTTLDLSYNKLKELPIKDFNARNLPYLQGLDISYNSFDHLPRGPMNSAYLMILNMRHQRDEQGNKIFRNWPMGVGKHHGLRRLFLGYNDIRSVPEKVSPRIFVFDIKGNENISIDLSHICPLIKNHMYMLFYDKTQDIRGCEELKEHYY